MKNSKLRKTSSEPWKSFGFVMLSMSKMLQLQQSESQLVLIQTLTLVLLLELDLCGGLIMEELTKLS